MLNVKGSNKNNFMTIRLTTEEKELIKSEAKKNNMTITDFIKTSINEKIKRS